MKILSYRYLPLNTYVAYSFFVLMSLFFGPIEYYDLDYFVLLPYVLILIFLFALGFMSGAQGDYRNLSVNPENRFAAYQKISKIFRVMLALGVVSSVASIFEFFFSGGGFGFGNLGDSYIEGYAGYERGQANINLAYIVNIFDQALITLVILLILYYFRVIGPKEKFAGIIILATYLVVNVLGTGKQKYLGDVVIFVGFLAMINMAATKKKFRMRVVFGFVLAMFSVVFMFVEILRQRYISAAIGLNNIHEKSHPLIKWDDGSLLYNIVGEDYTLALGIFLGYFSNGLYGLYLSLTLPFEWTYFVGNSYSLGRIMEIGISDSGTVVTHTYPYRVGAAYGWGFDKWHSLFSWLASDITFPGVLLLAPVFSYIYAKLWLQSIKASNPFAGALFIYLSLGLIFSYANNQIMHSLAGVMVLVALMSGWLLFNNKSNPMKFGRGV